jgi:hypothetical protein
MPSPPDSGAERHQKLDDQNGWHSQRDNDHVVPGHARHHLRKSDQSPTALMAFDFARFFE